MYTCNLSILRTAKNESNFDNNESYYKDNVSANEKTL